MKIGDQVSVIDEQISGKIISIKGNEITIEDQYGFPHHYLKTEVVLQEAQLYEGLKVIKKPEISKIISKKHDKKPLVLDLHFDKLARGSQNHDSFERLFLQREKLIQTIDYCRKNNLKKLEIIHGIGDGVLQKMVHDVLESQTNLEFYNKEILHHQSGSVLVDFR